MLKIFVILTTIIIIGLVPVSYSQYIVLHEQLQAGTSLDDITCAPYDVIAVRDDHMPICVNASIANMMNWKIEYVFPEEQNQRFIDLHATANDPLAAHAHNSISINNGGSNIANQNFNSDILAPFFAGTIHFDEIPTLNKTSSFKLSYGSPVGSSMNATESIDAIKSYFDLNPNKIPQYFTLTLVYHDSFDVNITNISYDKITYEKSDGLTYANIQFPNLYDRDYFTTLQYIHGTVRPTQDGLFQTSLRDVMDVADMRLIFVGTSESAEHDSNRIRTFVDTNSTLMYIPDASKIHREVWLQLSDEEKTKINVSNVGRITYMDPSIRDMYFGIVNNIMSERTREAVFSDMPDDIDMIYKMPKAKYLNISLNYSNHVQVGDVFKLDLNITSHNRTANYEQIYTEILLGDGLELHTNGSISSYKKRLAAHTDSSLDSSMRPALYNIVPIDYYASLRPNSDSITLSYLVDATQRGDWMFKIIYNDQIFYDRITVE